MENKPPKITFETIHNKKKYIITVSSVNHPSKEAIENCNKYINNLMNNI